MRKISKSQIVVAGLVCLFMSVWPQTGWSQGGDTCATAVAIASLPYSDTGDTTGQTDDYHEICPYSDNGGAPDVVYSYTPASNVVISIDLCNSSYDTRLFVYEGTCGAPDSGEQIACSDDDCGNDGYKSELPYVSLTAGNTYYIVVDGYGDYAGEYEINVTQVSTTTGACCDDTTGICQDGVEQSACTGRFSADTLCADLIPPCGGYAGDDCSNATVIPSLPYSVTGVTTGANDDYDEICPFDAPGAPDVVYSYTPATNQVIDISLCDSEYDTKVYVYENSCGAYQSGTQIACSDDACGDDYFKSLIEGLTLIAGNTYYIVVDGFGTQNGIYELDITGSSAVVGACCDDVTGICRDGVAQQNCTGRFAADTLCANLDPPCGSGQTLQCPNDTLFGQPAHGPADPWSGPISEAVLGGHVYENFAGLAGPICDIHWWGFQVDYEFEDCIEPAPVFVIGFYEDDNGRPGTDVCSYEVVASVTSTGIYYDFGGRLNQLNYCSVDDLSPCCSLTDGWVSITGAGAEDCWFMWITSDTGDGNSWSDYGEIGEPMGMDLSICLTGVVPDIRIEPLSFDDNCPQDPFGSFTIYNDGTSTLNVTDIEDVPAWVVGISPALPYSIPPEANQPVTVELDCCYCAGRGQLQVYSNDPDESPYPDAVFVNLNVIEGDLDSDCAVDMYDFSYFASHWLQTPCTSPDWCGYADITRNGSVGFEDLAVFVSNWLDEISFPGCEE
ncbi:MAG: hypothetical protein PHQ35_07435 [Phycisphaerae bacterium]|nr:hypothetical protein [Phycisphaerae bacterium]MDD5380966.1 hypothetical protein [Phycisphaerae bacterium]